MAKEEKYRRTQYEKALRQENRRLSLAQPAKVSTADQTNTTAAAAAATQANTAANAAASNSN